MEDSVMNDINILSRDHSISYTDFNQHKDTDASSVTRVQLKKPA
jgi:hypothetical protein